MPYVASAGYENKLRACLFRPLVWPRGRCPL